MTNDTQIPNELLGYFAVLVDEDLDKNRDHLQWLKDHPAEPDRDLQIAECERAVELAVIAQKLVG